MRHRSASPYHEEVIFYGLRSQNPALAPLARRLVASHTPLTSRRHRGQSYNLPIWVTEFALANQPLEATQAYFGTVIDYLERTAIVERYSYFGAFRSTVSNVGPNAAMLDAHGNLTDIGSWYLGGGRTGNVPTAGAAVGSVGSGRAAVMAAVVVGAWSLARMSLVW